MHAKKQKTYVWPLSYLFAMNPNDLWIPLAPVPKGNSRRQFRCSRTGALRSAPSRTSQRAEEAVTRFLRLYAPDEPLTGPVQRDACYVMSVPPSWPQWKREAALELRYQHVTRPDVGNLDKLLDDALEGAGWISNDSRICGGFTFKAYGAVPGYLVRLTPIPQATRTDPACPFVRPPLLPPQGYRTYRATADAAEEAPAAALG